MKHIATPQGVVENLGYCEFIATDKYRDNYDSIFGKKGREKEEEEEKKVEKTTISRQVKDCVVK